MAWWGISWNASLYELSATNCSAQIHAFRRRGRDSFMAYAPTASGKTQARRLLVIPEGAQWTPYNPIPPLVDRGMPASFMHRQGLPWRCVYWWGYVPNRTPYKAVYFGVVRLNDDAHPYLPLWPGLLANTAIYGSAWMIVLTGVPSAFRFARTRRRRARGCCTKCGYDLTGLADDAVCPECGSASR